MNQLFSTLINHHKPLSVVENCWALRPPAPSLEPLEKEVATRFFLASKRFDHHRNSPGIPRKSPLWLMNFEDIYIYCIYWWFHDPQWFVHVYPVIKSIKSPWFSTSWRSLLDYITLYTFVYCISIYFAWTRLSLYSIPLIPRMTLGFENLFI